MNERETCLPLELEMCSQFVKLVRTSNSPKKCKKIYVHRTRNGFYKYVKSTPHSAQFPPSKGSPWGDNYRIIFPVDLFRLFHSWDIAQLFVEVFVFSFEEQMHCSVPSTHLEGWRKTMEMRQSFYNILVVQIKLKSVNHLLTSNTTQWRCASLFTSNNILVEQKHLNWKT